MPSGCEDIYSKCRYLLLVLLIKRRWSVMNDQEIYRVVCVGGISRFTLAGFDGGL